jgi:hypothetical protein
MNCCQPSSENKENDYHHLVQISPEKQRKTHRHANILGNLNENGKPDIQEIPFGSMKKRKQLEELWLKPVISLDTSLEGIVDEGEGHECMETCDCIKEHILN